MERKPRRDRGRIRLNDRDLAVLTWIGEQYAVRLDTLQHLLGKQAQQATKELERVQESAARRVLLRWENAGLIDRQKLLAQEKPWIWLTGRGLREVGLGYRPLRPTVSLLRHTHMVNLVRLAVEVKYADQLRLWHSERRLRQQHYGQNGFHVPDGVIETHTGTEIGVEVELTLKSSKRAQEIVQRLARQYNRIWFVVMPQTEKLITEATKDWADRFRIYTLAEVLD